MLAGMLGDLRVHGLHPETGDMSILLKGQKILRSLIVNILGFVGNGAQLSVLCRFLNNKRRNNGWQVTNEMRNFSICVTGLLLERTGFLFLFVFLPCHVACRIFSFPTRDGTRPPLHWNCRVLTPLLPGKSMNSCF